MFDLKTGTVLVDFDITALKASVKKFLDSLTNVAFQSLADVVSPWPEKLSVSSSTVCSYVPPH